MNINSNGVVMNFINKYYALKLYSELGISSHIEALDVYDAEAFELIYLSIKKAEREMAKKARR